MVQRAVSKLAWMPLVLLAGHIHRGNPKGFPNSKVCKNPWVLRKMGILGPTTTPCIPSKFSMSLWVSITCGPRLESQWFKIPV